MRVAIQLYRARHYLHARKWYTDATSGELRPGKGLAIDVRDLPWLLKTLDSAEATALAEGLLDEESFESCGRPIPDALL